MSAVIRELADAIRNNDAPDNARLRQYNIQIGLRDDQGAGVYAGVTNKGAVIGYEKVPRASLRGEEAAPGDWVVDPAIVYRAVHGREPTGGELAAFIPKLRDILPYEFRPVEGQLLYCGIDAIEIARAHLDSFGYEEVVYLLLTGNLPDQCQLEQFCEYLNARRSLPSAYRNALVHQFSSKNIMNTLQAAVDNLYDLDPNPDSIDIEDVTRHSIDLIARFPVLVAYAYHGMNYKYKEKADLTIIRTDQSASQAEDFLRIFRAGKPFTREEALVLDQFLILHAEHGGGNNSTFTARVVSSSETDTFSAISSALASLKGHLHGGANEQVMSMMNFVKEEVKDWRDRDEVYAYLSRILRGQAADGKGKIYGVGHAVYTLSDPRAVYLAEMAEGLARRVSRLDEYRLFRLVAELAPLAFAEVKNTRKQVSPNVDFYSGFVLDCIGIPQELYTPLFSMSRVAGWCAHRLEQLVQNKLIRPAYLDLVERRSYVPLASRVGREPVKEGSSAGLRSS
jgi:citrate synthase